MHGANKHAIQVGLVGGPVRPSPAARRAEHLCWWVSLPYTPVACAAGATPEAEALCHQLVSNVPLQQLVFLEAAVTCQCHL
jgi:hypothetical protein